MRVNRIVDCEVYYNSKQHPDPFPHSVVNKHDHQLNMGTWFFNDACGLDITFGDSEIYASFLIRAIQDLQSDERTEGITKVVREIFIQLGDVFSERAVLRLSFNNSHFCREELPFRTTRVNLTKKTPDQENYAEKEYRFIILSRDMKDKENILTRLVNKGELSKEDATKILGYNKKNW